MNRGCMVQLNDTHYVLVAGGISGGITTSGNGMGGWIYDKTRQGLDAWTRFPWSPREGKRFLNNACVLIKDQATGK